MNKGDLSPVFVVFMCIIIISYAVTSIKRRVRNANQDQKSDRRQAMDEQLRN